MRRFQFLIIGLFLLVLAPVGVHARGNLVKGSLPAVYYLADDGTRFVFPNEKIYFSWYPDFSGVETIADEALAEYPIGGNVTYRPGTRLLKLVSDPKVYALEPGGVLRWVYSESLARALWGTSWALRVDDLPDGFFPAYAIGDRLDEARYPDGTLLQDATSGEYYIVWHGQKQLVTEEGLDANGWQTGFAVLTDTSEMDDGGTVTDEDENFADTAQLKHGEQQETAVVGSVAPTGSFILQGEEEQTLAAFTLSIRENMTVTNPLLRLDAHSSSRDSDADAGGLVWVSSDETESVAAFSRIRIQDENGVVLFGTANLQTHEDGDGSQTVTLAGSHVFLPGRHTLFVVADVAEETPENETFAVYWDLAGIEGAEVTVREPGLELDLAGSSASQTILRGEAGPHQVVAFDFTNKLNETASISSLTITGYIDEGEESEDFGFGSDEDDGSTLFVSEVVSSVSLAWDGEVVSTTEQIGADGHATFNGLGWNFEAQETHEVAVLVTIDPNAPFGLERDRIAFDIVSEGDIVVSLETMEEVNIIGISPNGGVGPADILTIVESGTLTIEGSGGGEGIIAMGMTDESAYAFSFTADEAEDIIVDKIALRLTDGESARSVLSGELHFTSDGIARTVTANVVAGALTFRDVGLRVPKDDAGEQETDVSVYVHVAGSAQGAVSGDRIGLVFEPGVFAAHGADSGVVMTEDDFGETLLDDTTPGGETVVRRNVIRISAPDSQVSGGADREAEAPVLRFKLFTEGEASARVQRLTFQIETSDAGTSVNDIAADNDALEYWADLNGDASDDNAVAELVNEASGHTVGEGSDGHMDYLIFLDEANTRDATPQGYDSQRGDLGILLYEFTFPLVVTSTGTEYTLHLDTSGFADGGQSVQVKLLGGADFGWGDGTLAGDDLTGDGIGGLPYNGPDVGID